MDAAARPLPSEETTPPVMKMYLGLDVLVVVIVGISRSSRSRRRQKAPNLFQIFRRVHTEGFVCRFDSLHANTVLQRAQLLERLGPLERGRLQGGKDHQR